MMLTSTLRSLAAGTAVLALTAWGISSLVQTPTSPYTPRPVAPAAQPDGAVEIRRMMLGDAEGNIDHEGLQALRRQVAKYAHKQAAKKADSDTSWVEMGPDNIGGRTRALAAVGDTILYAGSVSGGLWVSTVHQDGANMYELGDVWSQVMSFPNMMIGSIAVAGNGDLYVGTGTNFDGAYGEGGSGFRGDGIWWSNDGGSTFERVLDGNNPVNYTATDGLVADPNVSNQVWYASMSGYGSIANGQLSEVPTSQGAPTSASDVVIAPDGSYCLVASASGRVYRSINGDFGDLEIISQSGNNLNGALPQGGVGRARIDIAPSPNAEGEYNAFAMYATSSGLFYGLFYSGDQGVMGSWAEVWPGEIQTATPLPRAQGIYDLALGISKSDPELAYVGGIEIWRSGPNQQAEQAAAAFDAPGFPFGVHADVHEIMFLDNGTEDGLMFVATDGGIYRSSDNGYSYTACNRNFNVTQFYGMAHSAGSGVLGGTQDNGSLFIPGDGYFLSDLMAEEVHGGDGFDCAISLVTEAEGYDYAWFAASQNGGLVRGTLAPGEVNNTGFFYDDNFTALFSPTGDLGQFYTCTRLYEDFDDEYNKNSVILINTFGQDSVGGTYTLSTLSQNLPFEFNMGSDTLHFYEVLVRPERTYDAPLTEDPDYWWLELPAETEDVVCVDIVDTLGVDSIWTEPVPIYVDSTVVVVNSQGDSTEFVFQVPTGMYDSTLVYDVTCTEVMETIGYDTLLFEIECTTVVNDTLDSMQVWEPFPVFTDSTIYIVNEAGDTNAFDIVLESVDSALVWEYTLDIDTLGCDTTLEVEPVVITYEVCDSTAALDYTISSSTTCDTSYIYASDTLYNVPERLRVRDPYNSMFVLGLNGNLGVWMTREALNFNTTPSWMRIANSPSFGGTKAIEFVETGSEAGDVMFFTGWNGQVTRVSGLREVYSQSDVDSLEVVNLLTGAGAAVTGLSIDPADANHVVITVGGYGTNDDGKVRQTFNALSPDFDPDEDWEDIWTGNGPDIDGFDQMPCYDVVIDANSGTLIVGTEFGIFESIDGGASWDLNNGGMETGEFAVTAPVFDLKQQIHETYVQGETHLWSNVSNYGVVYAGTHGRGIFRRGEMNATTDVDEQELASNDMPWNVFPNPVSGDVLNLPGLNWQGQVSVEIFDLTGRRWVQQAVNASGLEFIQTDVRELPAGYYVVRMAQGDKVKAAKFMVSR